MMLFEAGEGLAGVEEGLCCFHEGGADFVEVEGGAGQAFDEV